jgi:hypothetical protein
MLIYVFAIFYVLMYICNGGFTCSWKSCDWMVCNLNYLAGVSCYPMELLFYFSIRFCIAALLHTHTHRANDSRSYFSQFPIILSDTYILCLFVFLWPAS